MTAVDFWLLAAGVVLFMMVWPVQNKICEESDEAGYIGTEGSAFATIEDCIRSWAWVIALFLVVCSLIYFPLKIHFTFVLHAFQK